MSEKRRWPQRLLIGVAAAIVIAIGAVLAAPLVVPSAVIADRIAGLVRGKTGRELRIAGPISFSLFPRVALVAHDVALASPTDGFSQDFLTVKTVDVALRPLPLLRGAIEIDRLVLSEPTVHFEVDKDGERNWVFRRPTSTPSPLPVRPVAPPSFATGNATIRDGAATYLDRRSGFRRAIDGVALTLSLPDAGPLDAAGTARLNGDTVSVAASIASPTALRDGGPSQATLDLHAPHATFGFRGEVDGTRDTTGSIDFKTPSLSAFLAWVDPRLVPQGSDLGALAVSGTLDLGDAIATLSDATTTLDDVTARGTLMLHHADDRLELDTTDLALAGGKGAGKLVADETGDVPKLALTLSLTGVTFHALPVHIAGFDRIGGTGDASLDLTAGGATLHDIVRSLGGTARIALADGTIAAAGLGRLLKNALGPAVGDKTIPQEIAYRSLAASATIDDGVLHNDDLRLAGPALTASGAGTLDLARRTLDYLWQPDIPGLGSGRIAISGAWDNPDYKLESLNIDKTKGFIIPGLRLR